METRFPPEERHHIEEDSMRNAREYLDKIVASLKEDGVGAESEVLFGEPVEKLVEFADEKLADLFIISTHGRSGVSRWVWGSVTDRILRAACVPVLMVRAPGCIAGI